VSGHAILRSAVYGEKWILRLTARTAAVGGAFAPIVMVFHIASKGGSSSHATVNNGESHLTMDEGSSKRMMRLSNLRDCQRVA
jgi:hypothetical protein